MCAHKIGEYAWALKLYRYFLPLIVFEQQPGVGVRKEVYRLRGLMDDTYVRHPGNGCTKDVREQLELLIKNTFVRPGMDLTKRVEVNEMIFECML